MDRPDAVAIIGMAFRLPGDLATPSSLWQALAEGRDLVTNIPAERWQTAELQHPKRSEPGRSITFAAGVISRIDEFDAAFFGISPREAAQLDPQQRILLELAWEAIENSGTPAARLAGSDCAVYVGLSSLDYGCRSIEDSGGGSAHSMTGSTLSLASNRISYVLDLHGQSLTLDTACSSSMVALHQACRAVLSGESGVALAGGVNILLHPYSFVGFTKASMLAADGRCRPFDAAGSGYVRAEGGVVLMLKRLDRAIADGDPIQAVVLASGVNTDGSRKTGITIPSYEGQAELMRTVLAKAGLTPDEVDYIEAHGTGTPVGDPIECAAIGAVYGQDRAAPMPIGSVKGNLGHLEPVSGLAGLVKTVLALQRHQLPPQVHFNKPNAYIDFPKLNLQPVTQLTGLDKDGPLVAGINSFGFGGANAHVLLQEYRAGPPAPGAGAPALFPLAISTRGEPALRELAACHAADLAGGSVDAVYATARAVARHRDRLAVRLGLWVDGSTPAAGLLHAFAKGEPAPGVVVEHALTSGKRGVAAATGVAFVYAGNGSQWVGMGRNLLKESPGFAARMAELDASMRPVAGFSVLDELRADGAAARLDDTLVAQPVLFAIQVALTEELARLGVVPQAVAGHSVGEVAAAWASGSLDLETAIRVIVVRSRTQALTRGTGRMAAVGMAAAELTAALAACGADGEIVLAGINSPRNITVAGPLSALERFQASLQASVFFKVLDLDYAFHSPAMEPVREPLLADLDGLAAGDASGATFISTVTGGRLEAADLAEPGYWWDNVRQPVRFEQAVCGLHAAGCTIFLEIGPHAILQRYIQETLTSIDAGGGRTRVLGPLRKGADGLDALREAALRTILLADDAMQAGFFAHPSPEVALPNYPWQRERHWFSHSVEYTPIYERPPTHPLLGWRLNEADWHWEAMLDPQQLLWLADHCVDGLAVFPAAGFAEMALAAARAWRPGAALAVEELDILAPLTFDGEHARWVRFELQPRDGGFVIRSRQRLSTDAWTIHAAGRLLQHCPPPALRLEPVAATVEARTVDHETFYERTRAIGLGYGPCFRTVRRVRVLKDHLVADLEPPAIDGYVAFPGLLDGCLQTILGLWDADAGEPQPELMLPVKFGTLRWYPEAGAPVRLTGRMVRRGARVHVFDFEVSDADGRLCGQILGCRLRAVALGRKQDAAVPCWRIDPWLQPHPAADGASWLPASSGLVAALAPALASCAEVRGIWARETLPLLEALTTSFVFEAFHAIAAAGPAAWQALMSASDPYAAWTRRLLRDEGLLTGEAASAGGTWSLAEPGALPPAADIWRALIREHTAVSAHLTLIGRVGLHLSAILPDAAARAELRRSLQRAAVPEGHQLDHPAAVAIHASASALVEHLLAVRPSGRRLRVLDLCPAAPAGLHAMLAATPADTLDYTLAMPAPVAERVGGELRQHPHASVIAIDAATCDLSGMPAGQLFDVVLVRHQLHLAASAAAALGGIAARLAAGGCIVVAEDRPARWSDLLGGLDPAWWRDGTASSLLPSQAWGDLLRAAGFADVSVHEPAAVDGLAAGSCLVVARRAAGAAAPPAPVAAASWLLCCDPATEGWCGELQRLLAAQGQQVALSTAERPVPGPGVQHVVWCRGWDAPVAEAAGQVQGLVAAAQDLALAGGKPPRLWVVTRGGALAASQPAGSCAARPVQSALWGLGRVVLNELPDLGCTLVDAATAEPAPACPLVVRELLQPDGVRELVLTDAGRFALRMHEDRPEAAPASADGDQARYRLDLIQTGQLGNLRWVPAVEPELRDGEAEVRVHAAGLNFRDVMYALGLLPDEILEKGFAGAAMGLECAGVVTRVGPGVEGLAPGDRVMGFGSGCLASHVRTPAVVLVPIPASWSFTAAATVPSVFFTVHYALKHLADLQPGERVLIHGGAGGVGIAAIQLATHLGAEVFATAGSQDKRDFVRLLGADHVFDSRSLAFADEILAATGGKGVDVVLNSLAGEAMRRSIAVLTPFGRFLELGKRDFAENTPVGLRPFKDNISYFGIDADQLQVARPALSRRIFREVMELFGSGVLTPLPARVFDADRVVEAFRTMQQARHIGKVVLHLGAAPVAVRAEAPPAQADLAGGSWLITGGIAGFGLSCARWLAAQGATHLALLGRRGAATPGAAAALAELEALGATVRILACDVSDATQVRAAFAEVAEHHPPLTGVLHAAAVFDDALLLNLTPARTQAVVNPKLVGAWNLHEASLGLSLRHFVLFSSVTTLLGSGGQGNYVAANAGLEGLTALRRASGLPASCLCWGPLADAGYLARNEAVAEAVEQRLGRPPIEVRQALARFAALLERSHTVAPAAFHWQTLERLLPSAGTVRFAWLNRGLDRSAAAGDADIRTLIAGKSRDEVVPIIADIIRHDIARIMAISPERIDPTAPLHGQGLDSLMAVELALGLERRLGITLSVMMLNDSPTIEKVARKIAAKLVGGDEGTTETTAQAVIAHAQQHGVDLEGVDVQGLVEQAQTVQGAPAP